MTSPTAATPDRWTGLVEMTTEECWDRLRAAGAGRVAVSVGTTPDIFPVNYLIRDDEIVIRTEAGTKLAAATLMNAVAFEIDEIDPVAKTGWSVVVKGHGREATKIAELEALEELDMDPWVATPKPRWLVITPHEVTGRRVPDHDTPNT